MNRREMRTRFVTMAVVACLLCCETATAKKPPKPPPSAAYTIIPFMPAGSQSTDSAVHDINEVGQAIGKLEYADGNDEAVHLDIASGVYTTLSDCRVALSINNLNQIVGINGDYDSGLFWNRPSASPISLPRLPGDHTSLAKRINDAGIIVGESRGLTQTKVVWRVYLDENQTQQVDGPKVLPPLQQSVHAVWDINEVADGTAQLVGESDGEAVIWTVEVNENGTLAAPAAAVSMGTLSDLGVSWSAATAINNFADVCGNADDLPFVAFLGQETETLPVPRKLFNSRASDINDSGDIVGEAEVFVRKIFPVDYAQLWRDGQRIDLTTQIPDDSGWGRLREAWRINNSGVIAGWGDFDVINRGFIMIPNE